MKSREEEQRHYRKKVNKGICLQALLNQSNSSVPASWPLRLFLASWWVTAYVIVMSYTCNLIAFLTIPASPVKLESVQQLANSHHRFVLYCREKLDRFLYNYPYTCMCLYKCTCVYVFIYVVMKRISHPFLTQTVHAGLRKLLTRCLGHFLPPVTLCSWEEDGLGASEEGGAVLQCP